MRDRHHRGDGAIAAGAILRRPAAFDPPPPGPLPAAAHPGGTGLPGFLGRRQGDNASGGLWRDGDGPIDIGGFDPREDVLSLTFLGPGPVPALSLRQDEVHRVTTILANGKPVAALRGAGPGFSLANVAAARRPG